MSVSETAIPKLDNTAALWRLALLSLACVLLVLFGLFLSTAQSMVTIWNASETYTHGYVILPISLWLIWKRRDDLLRLEPRPAYPAVFFLLVVLAAWAIARVTSVSVVEQFAFVALLIVCTWLILGHEITRRLAFPLFFLFFSVPMGQDLVPPLMEFTADFTVGMLELSGIPVFREGLYFEVPTGRWSVVEACSGIRYLIASATLGFLYAYLVYVSLWRRALFVVVSILVPIIANGLRAYFIVLLGHLSDMKLAVGIDHLVYGWVFFGIVMAILFWLGSFWSEARQDPQPPAAAEPSQGRGSFTSLIAASLLVPLTAYPVSTAVLSFVNQENTLAQHAGLPVSVSGWEGVSNDNLTWRPQIENPAHEVVRTYKKEDKTVSLYVAMFPKQERHSEAISSMNRLVDPKQENWRVYPVRKTSLPGLDLTVGVSDIVYASYGRTTAAYRVWDWYRIGEYYLANSYMGKLREIQNFLLEGRTDGAYIGIATPRGREDDAADRTLESFLRDMLPTIGQTVDRSVFGDIGPGSE